MKTVQKQKSQIIQNSQSTRGDYTPHLASKGEFCSHVCAHFHSTKLAFSSLKIQHKHISGTLNMSVSTVSPLYYSGQSPTNLETGEIITTVTECRFPE